MRLNIIADAPLLKAGKILTKTYKNDIFKPSCKDVVRRTCSFDKYDSKHQHDHDFNPKSNLTPYVLMVALSIHGLFEGIALGLQEEFQQILYLGIAIIAHKWAESFTLGISLFKINTDYKTFIKLIVLYSLFTPIGIVIGILLKSSSVIIEAIFLSLSSGTFIYISASEVIVEEFSVSKHKNIKFIMFLIGAIFIGGLAFLEVALKE